MGLRDYQQRAIDQIYQWFEDHPSGNPCLVMPTGSGKSWVIAELCRDALQSWPTTRILILSHVKEILTQDLDKIFQVWPMAPVGVYSAGLGKKEIEPITVAGIQSVRNKAARLGHVDICIVDEAHLISHKDQGGYRKLIKELTAINPALRVVGLTASPYRLGHGLITEGEALFDALIEPVGIEELIYKGFLVPLQSKDTGKKLSTDGVGKRGGEYIESELQRVVDTEDNNSSVVAEIIERGSDRKSWLLFCAGVDHAQHIADQLSANGIRTECVTGGTPKQERDRILNEFRGGALRAVTNCQVLTTGFDHPGLDLIVFLRPTLSPGLYLQMAGRGMRPATEKQNCMVLDFAGLVAAHGPITCIQPPKKKGTNGQAPVKVCPECREIVHASKKECPVCGFVFPPPIKERDLRLRDDDIMGHKQALKMEVNAWLWREHTSMASGKQMLKVSYYGSIYKDAITEYLPVTHGGYAGERAMNQLLIMADKAGVVLTGANDLGAAAIAMSAGTPPTEIRYHKDGKYHRVDQRIWKTEERTNV